MADAELKVDPNGYLTLDPDQQLRELAAKITARAVSGCPNINGGALVHIIDSVADYIKNGLDS